jgi:hypothetical protein
LEPRTIQGGFPSLVTGAIEALCRSREVYFGGLLSDVSDVCATLSSEIARGVDGVLQNKKIVVFIVKRVESHATTLNDIPYGLLFRNRLGNRTSL